MENSMEIPQKVKKEILYNPAVLLLGSHMKNAKIILWKDTHHPYVCCRFIYNSLGIETTQLLIDGWIKNRIYTHTHTHTHTNTHTIHIYTIGYYSAIKRQNLAISDNMDGY